MSSSLMVILRKIADIWYGPLRQKICFVHIPKCGGQSIDYAIRRHCLFSNVNIQAIHSFNAAALSAHLPDPSADDYDRVLQFREQLLIYQMFRQNIRFVSGHFCFSERVYRHFYPQYRFITLLRHPVKRWISSYFFHRYKTHSDYIKIEEDLPVFLTSKRARLEGHRFVQMIGGLHEAGDYTSQEAIERAKANLHHFEIVGFLEDLDAFYQQFRESFGVSLARLQKNTNPKPQASIQSMLTEEIETEITRLCQPDLEVYQYAVKTFAPALL